MFPKGLFLAFYRSDLANNPNIIPKFFHGDCGMYWNTKAIHRG